jgi:hypothetical protein
VPLTLPSSVSAIRVRSVAPGDDPRWDEYVRPDPRAGAYHLGAWAEILKRTYGYRPSYLAAESGSGELAGVLPLVHGRGLMGSRLTSLPVAWSAGPLGTSPAVESTLVRAAQQLALDRGARRLLIKSRLAEIDGLPPGVVRTPYEPAWELPLDAHDDLTALWRSEKRLWRGLRKAEKSGLEVREGSSEADLRAFHALYLITMRKHRALPRPYRQLALTRAALGPEGFRLWLVEHEGRTIAGGIFYVVGDRVELIYNASAEEHLSLRLNHALYAHAVRWAQERGARVFDFGGAGETTSLADFKRQWGAQRRPVYVYGTERALGDNDRDRTGGGADAERKRSRGRAQLERLWDRAPVRLTEVAGAVGYRFL